MITANVQRNKRSSSAAVAASLEKRSTHKPVAVTGIGEGKLINITVPMFSRLDVDPSYQRGETSMVNSIIRALLAGGKVLDPVSLCERSGSDRLWIVDGYQRVCAYQQLQMPFRAMIYRSDSQAAEHDFFIAMNSKRSVSANIIVKAWNGPSGTMLRRANESLEHPLSGRINFTQSSSGTKFSAASVITGMRSVIGVVKGGGRIEVAMSRIDTALSKRLNVERVEKYLRLLGYISPNGLVPALVLRALGAVAYERWESSVSIPSAKIITRLSNRNWATEVVLVDKYMPVLIESIRKIWKE